MENFSNLVLGPQDIPTVENEKFNPISKKQLIVLYTRIAFFFFIIAGGFITFLILSEEVPSTNIVILVAAFVVLIFCYSVAITAFGFQKKGYLVRENDLSYQKGLIRYKLISVPFNRIQHVEVSQGILAKYLGLATIKTYTAGGNSSDLSIPGLPSDIAQNLKAFLSEKIAEHE